MRPVAYVRACTGYRPSDSVRRSLGPFRSTGCATDTRFDIHVEPEIRRAQAFSRPMATGNVNKPPRLRLRLSCLVPIALSIFPYHLPA